MKMFKLLNIFISLNLTLLAYFALAKNETSLSEAFQREYIYLQGQKKNLINSKQKTDLELKKDINDLERQVEVRMAQLNQIDNQITTKQQELTNYQDLINKSENQKKKMLSLSQQANETLKLYERSVASDLNLKDSLQESFVAAEGLLNSIDSVQKKEKDIFNIKGEKSISDIYQFGLIATMSLKDSEMGLLAPAGLGQLKEIDATEKYNPTAVKEDGSQKFFLYDSLNKAFEPKAEKTWGQILEAGGLIGYVILMFGLFAIFIALKRFLILKKYDFDDKQKQDVIKKINERKRVKTENQNLQWQSHPALGPVYAELKYPNIANAKSDAETIIISLEQKITSYSPVLLGVAAVAPLLGLLGTVTGMISTFDVITDIGTGNPKMLSGGISEALVTTQFGLIVAIPCLLVGNWLNSWSKRIVKNLYEIFDITTAES